MSISERHFDSIASLIHVNAISVGYIDYRNITGEVTHAGILLPYLSGESLLQSRFAYMM